MKNLNKDSSAPAPDPVTKKKGRADWIDKHAGMALRHIRTQRGMSQTALADKIGVTFQQVQKYETGANRIALGRLADIAEVLETPVVSFFPEEYRGDNGLLDQHENLEVRAGYLKSVIEAAIKDLERAIK